MNDDLNDKVEKMRHAEDLVFAESLRRRVFTDLLETGEVSTGADINQTVPDGDPIDAPQAADQKVRVTIDGNDYYIALYNV